MKLNFQKCNVTDLFVTEKGVSYMTLSSDEGSFKVHSRNLALSDVPRFEPLSIQMDVKGRLYNGNQSLEVISIDVRPWANQK